jgi:transcriptional regulator with XRE-family HTH domain
MAPRKKKRKPPSPEALTLMYLRSKRGWTQKELGDRLGLGDHARISRFERGEKPLYREKLIEFAAVLGYPPEAVDLLLLVHRWLEPVELVEPSGPADLTVEEQRALHRTVLAATGAFMAEVQREMLRKKRERKADLARRKARELWLRLKEAPRQDQRDLVAAMPAFQDWALAVHVCEASVRAAAHRPEDALHLADLAVLIASRSPGGESWRSRLEGFCWAHLANARRVANDLVGADTAFVKAWELWRAGDQASTELFPEWRLFDLEGSLRRDQRRFSEALALLEQAKSGSKGNKSAVGRILLKKEFVLEQMGDPEGALVALQEALPIIEATADLRLSFALHFKIANNLWHLKRYQEAEDLLPELRELAVQLGNELDLIRIVWLEARIAAGQGRREKAASGLEHVRLEFTARNLPYDAALSSLDLALLWLEAGHMAKVREISIAMAWIFKSGGIQREALAALYLFRDAAEKENATIELTRKVISEVKKVASHPLHKRPT